MCLENNCTIQKNLNHYNNLNKTNDLNKIINKINLDNRIKNNLLINDNIIEYRLNNNIFNPTNNSSINDWHKRLENRINNLLI